MKRLYSIRIKSVLSLMLILLFLSIAAPLQGNKVNAQEEQPTPTETQAIPAAPSGTPVITESQATALTPDTPTGIDTQTTEAATETPNAVETQTALPPAEISVLLETPVALPIEPPANPPIPLEMPAQPAMQQPGSNILKPNSNTLLPAGEIQAKAIAAGNSHTCALTSTGGVKCWGLNSSGQLGNNTYIDSKIPVNVSGMSNGISAITVGGAHTCAITADGNVKCWGSNNRYQLGNESVEQSPVPLNVSGLTGGIRAISAGYDHTCALTMNNGVKCWGSNYSGQLGNGNESIYIDSLPSDVNGLTSGIRAISAAYDYTCALTMDNGVKCWGDNYHGQLGNNSTVTSYMPVDVSGLFNGVSEISVGMYHTCARTTDNKAKCWGWNDYGQLGNNSTTDSHVPVDVSGLTNGVSSISAGGAQTCAMITGGAVKCWGNNEFGQLGNNSATNKSVPVNVYGLTSGIKTIDTGGLHTCALTTGGGIKCWGENIKGQLGNNATTNSRVPVNVIGFWGSGFASQFNGNKDGWETVQGKWAINNAYLYSTTLGSGGHASIAFTLYSYSTLDYSVRLQRTGCDTCATKLFIRGSGVASANAGWSSGYQFNIKRNGYFYVGKIINGIAYDLKAWTPSSAIAKGSAWNILRVVAKGSSLKFYINNRLVWSGSNTSFSTGKVGLDIVSNGTGGINRLFVDYATLSTTVVGVAGALDLTPAGSSASEKSDPNGGNW